MSNEIVLSNNNEAEEGLVFIKKDNVYTSSKIIAEFTETKHHSITKLVQNYADDFKRFGALKVGFEIEPSKTNQKKKIYLLNEQQAYLLLTYLRNNKIVREFKINLISQFFEMKECLTMILTAREENPELTSHIEMLHENPKPYHYSNEFNMINKIVTGMSTKQFRIEHNIPKNESIRPYLSKNQLKLLDYLLRVFRWLLVLEVSVLKRL